MSEVSQAASILLKLYESDSLGYITPPDSRHNLDNNGSHGGFAAVPTSALATTMLHVNA